MRRAGAAPAVGALKRLALAFCILMTGATARAAGQGAGAATPAAGHRPFSKHLMLVPLPGQWLRMRTTVLRPKGPGPFPLVVINHGSSENSVERAMMPMPLYPAVSQWFLDRGYVVALPLRPGHGATGGPYFEDQGHCDDADYVKSGLATATSIQAAIDALTAQAYVRKKGVVVVGQSAGGWGAIALASRNPPMVRAVISFAGGRGGHADGVPDHNCSPLRLIAAAGAFGQVARTPTLWLYARNDTYFPPPLSRAMFKAFAGGSKTGEYHLLPPSGVEGHFFAVSPGGPKRWGPIVAKFLAAHP